MTQRAHWIIYVDKVGEHRSKFVAANGETLFVSSEGYINQRDCIDAIGIVEFAYVKGRESGDTQGLLIEFEK